MNVEPHDLDHEFPEFRETISALRTADPQFAGLFEAYTKVDVEVRGLEEHDIPVSDELFEDLKKQRVALKDELYAMLNSRAAR